MQNGKIYDGHIVGETQWNVLLSNPQEGHARFYPKRDILTIVREDHTPPPAFDPQRYISFEGLLGGSFFVSRELGFSPALDTAAEAGFRLFPWMELGTTVGWMPELAGDLQVSDGSRLLREYRSFWSYQGGFWGRFFPFAPRHWLIEPYLFTGFNWVRLLPKATDDALKGTTWRFGVGCQRVLYGSLYGDLRLLYSRTRFDSIDFSGSSDDLASDVANDHISLLLGVSYHLD